MTAIDHKMLDLAFVSRTSPMLSDCIRRIESDVGLSATRRRDLASGLRRLARILDRPPEEIPADPTWLQPRVDRVSPAACDLKPKSWSNLLSDVRAAFVHCGIVERRTRRLDDLSPMWRPLWEKLLASGDQSLLPALGRFVRFLDRCEIAPDAVEELHAHAYRDALALNELRRSPDDGLRQAVYGWNLATKRIEAWPQQTLTLPARDNRYALRLDAFPATFRDDLELFIRRLECPDPLAPQALRAPLRPATVSHRRAQTIRFASALVHSGVDITKVTHLGVLVIPDHARQGLSWMLDRNDGKSSPGISDIATLLKILVRHHVVVPDETRQNIETLAGRLALPQAHGITAKNRERLRPFDEKKTVSKLLQLPQVLADRARSARPRYGAFLDMEVAVAIALLTCCPIRRKNLATLHLDHNLRRMKDGRVFLVFAPGEVKNSRTLEFELPRSVIDLIDEHVRTRHPVLCPAGVRWLFPRRDGEIPMELSGLSRKISKMIHKEIGQEMNPHLFRHLAAKLMLEAKPGYYEVVRRLLGHAELSSTLNAYAGFEAGTALVSEDVVEIPRSIAV